MTKPVLCENYFKKLSITNQDELDSIINEGMGVGHLTIALPYLAVGANIKYYQTIVKHLYHDSPVVREGALEAIWAYGKKYKNLVKFHFEEMVEFDENTTIRQIAKDYCEELVENYDIWFGEEK